MADYVLVPRDATEAMIEAAWADANDEDAKGVWNSMISTAARTVTVEEVARVIHNTTEGNDWDWILRASDSPNSSAERTRTVNIMDARLAEARAVLSHLGLDEQ